MSQEPKPLTLDDLTHLANQFKDRMPALLLEIRVHPEYLPVLLGNLHEEGVKKLKATASLEMVGVPVLADEDVPYGEIKKVFAGDKPMKSDELKTLKEENHLLRTLLVRLYYMARRYASGRHTGAPHDVNVAADTLLRLGIPRERLQEHNGALYAYDPHAGSNGPSAQEFDLVLKFDRLWTLAKRDEKAAYDKGYQDGCQFAGSRDLSIALLTLINAEAEEDMLKGNPIEGAHHRAIERKLKELREEGLIR